MFPTAPNVDGLPVWLQLAVCLPFILATLGAAWAGYRRRVDREPSGAAQTVVAAFPDMGAFRQLNDTCRELLAAVEKLEISIRDQTHYLRDNIDVCRELCGRARELREEIVRSDRQRAEGRR